MSTEELISIDTFITHYKVEVSFVHSLQQYGLIETTTIENTTYIYVNELHKLERIVRLYYDMDINIEGIEAITHLLNRVSTMQQEITDLKNRLSLYEG